MPDNQIHDRLATLLTEQLYDRGQHVADWPEDEQALQRDPNAWTDFTDRAEKIQALRYRKAADTLLAAGWQPPARVITDATELPKLPHRAVVRDNAGDIFERWHTHWYETGREDRYDSCEIALPATVLYVPEEAAR